jgi:hypothetical protein
MPRLTSQTPGEAKTLTARLPSRNWINTGFFQRAPLKTALPPPLALSPFPFALCPFPVYWVENLQHAAGRLRKRRFTRSFQPMSVDLNARLKAAAELVSPESVMELVRLLWTNDRLFTYPAFQTTAKAVHAKLNEWGVQSKIFDIPADGSTVLGDWKMPLGWDCSAATLTVCEPDELRGRVLADRQERPTHVIMWSGPTPPEGLTAPLIQINSADEMKAKSAEIAGKIVYLPVHPLAFKKALADLGALAVVTSWCRSAAKLPDDCFWFNAWSDNPSGWAFHAGDTPLPGMVVTPRTGRELEEWLKKGPVVVKMSVDSRYFSTTIPVVSGHLEGATQEDVLAIGHSMEPGANDNASGAAVILESLRVIQAGVAAGKLPPLRRGIRGLLVNECYGTIGFAALNPGLVRRMVVGINWDTVGRHNADSEATLRHHRCPDAMASAADVLMDLMLENWVRKQLPYSKLARNLPYSLTDNAYCDPELGVMCVYVDSQDAYWHTSADKPETLCPKTLHAFATVSVAYLHFLASASLSDAVWLSQQTVRYYGKQVEDIACDYAVKLESAEGDKSTLLARAYDHLAYLLQISDKAILSARLFMPKEDRTQGRAILRRHQRHLRRLVDLEQRRLKEIAGCDVGALPPLAELGELADLRPLKKFIGTPAYDGIPRDKQTAPSPVWAIKLHSALFWADGTLPLREIARRVNFEFGGNSAPAIAQHFRFMGEHGLLQWLKEGDDLPKTTRIRRKSAAMPAVPSED